MKTILTVLLAVMVVGTVTHAYAQSNSDRIKIIQDNTESLIESVDGISETLATLIPDSLQESIDAISAGMATLTGQLDVITQSSARVESTISSMDTTLSNLLVSVQQNRATLTDLSGIMATMNTDISDIKASLASQGDEGLGTSIDILTTTVNRNEITVSDRLDSIEAAIERLETKLDGAPSTTLPATGIMRNTATMDVSSYTYQTQGTKSTVNGFDVYTLTMTFSCTGPVSIDTVSTDLTSSVGWIITTSNPHSGTTAANYLKVDGRELYNSKFESTPGSYIVYNRGENYNLFALITGNTLNFESQQYEQNNRIRDATRDANDGYTITVSYLGDRSTTCSFSGAAQTPSTGTLDKSDSVFLSPSLVASSLLSSFNVDVTCGNNPVEITNLLASFVDGWNPSFASFSTFEVEDASGNTLAEIGFNADGTLKTYDYPISFSGQDISITGSFAPLADSNPRLLIQMSYNTVSNGSCSQKTG